MAKRAPAAAAAPTDPSKRTKSLVACASCRKLKTRCETDPAAPYSCHRCTVLTLDCSFRAAPPPVWPQPAGVPAPAPPPPPPPPDAPMPSIHALTLDNIFPTREAPWGRATPPGAFNWLATPVRAVALLAARYPHPAPPRPAPAAALADVLVPAEVDALRATFDADYAPWLAAPPVPRTPLCDTVCCAVVKRDPQLHMLAEAAVAAAIANPGPDAPYAVLVAAMWAPVPAESWDGRVLAAAAVKMVDSSHPLWTALTNADSLSCIGTDRRPVCTPARTIDAAELDTPEQATTVRAQLAASILELAERGTQVTLADDFDAFYRQVRKVLRDMDQLRRILTPLPVVSEHQVAYFQALLALHHACRLLVLNSALREMRQALQAGGNGRTWYTHQHRGLFVALGWGKDATLTSEAVLTALLASRADLGTAPDALANVVSFAAVFLVMIKFSVLRMDGRMLVGSGERLLALVVRRLREAARGPAHQAGKLAQLVAAMVAKWEGTPKGRVQEEASLERTNVMGQAAGVAADMAAEAEMEADADVVMDAEFWVSFMSPPVVPSDSP